MRIECLVPVLFASICGAQPAPVIAHWPLDELVDGKALETGPHDLDATLTGAPPPEVIEGRVGGALRFGDGDAALIVPRHDVLDLKLPFTVAVWMRPEKKGVSMELVCRAADSATDGWRLRTGWGQVTFELRTPDGPVSVGVPARSVPEDHWVHVAVTADGQMLRLYLNAELVAETACTSAPVATRRELVLGNYVGRKDAYPYVGALDDVWLLGACLDAEALYRLAAGQEPLL